MKIGDKLKGKITGIQPYGAFVELESGLIGLIHISEIRTGYIDNIHDILKIGDQVLVQVVDYDRCKIGFAPLGKQLPIWIREAKAFLKEQKE